MSRLKDFRVQDFRVSFIWFETLLSLLDYDVPDPQAVPFSFLGRNTTYEQKFNEIQNAKGRPDKATGLTLPWPSAFKHNFWVNYLNYFDVRDASERLLRLAWEKSIPFRELITFTAGPFSSLQVDFLLEAFYYPHGLALVATVRSTQDMVLDDAIKLAFQVRRDEHLALKTVTDAPLSTLSLDHLAHFTLDILHEAWGKGANAGIRRVEPFTIFTIVQGSAKKGLDINAAVALNDEIHHALESILIWDESYLRSEYTPTPLDRASLHIKYGEPASHLLYGLKRGRAVWFPTKFTSTDKRDFARLAAYHRNLVLLSMQVESLYGLVAESKKRLNDPHPFPPTLSERVRRAVEHLAHFYTGISTYQSWSARAQLQNERLQVIDTMRTFWNMEPISLTTPSITEDNNEAFPDTPVTE